MWSRRTGDGGLLWLLLLLWLMVDRGVGDGGSFDLLLAGERTFTGGWG